MGFQMAGLMTARVSAYLVRIIKALLSALLTKRPMRPTPTF
jgi:hypothetical protein